MTFNASQFVVRDFSHLADLESRAVDYSALKFGSDRAAKFLGYEMADRFFELHESILISNRCVIVPSAFNVIENAAAILARHFRNRLNNHLAHDGYRPVEWTFMHRTLNYVGDYCLMSRDERAQSLKKDSIYLNRDFVEGKVLLFVDDMIITGMHERNISDLMRRCNLTNPHIFCYYSRYNGDQADIESVLNLSGIHTIDDYIRLIREPRHHLVVRAVRFLLDGPVLDLKVVLNVADNDFTENLYFACLALQYDKVDSYAGGFEMIRAAYSALQTAAPSLEVVA